MNKPILKGTQLAKGPMPTAEEFRHLPALLLGLALLAGVISYWPALGYGFTFDDNEQIVQNPALQSWDYLPQYFTANVWAGVFPGHNGSYYRPLFLLWLRLNYVLFNLTPWGWHLTSLLLHVAVVWVFFLLVRRWTGDGVVAGWGALLFAVHPIHIESVTWVSAAPEALFTLAGLGAIYCYLRFCQGEHRVWLAVAALLYAIALLAKETAVAIWPMIAACDWWLERSSGPGSWRAGWTARVRRQIPFAVMTVSYIDLRLYALRGLAGGPVTHTPAEVMCAAPSLVWFYLRKLVWPSGLSPIYFGPETGALASPHFYVPLIAVCAVAAGLFFWARKSRAAAFPALLIGLSLVPPVVGVSVFLRHDLAHNRYLYVPAAGVCMLAALALRAATRGERRFAGMNLYWLGHGVVAGAVLCLVFSVRVQERPYHDNVALFSRAVEISPQSAQAWGYLGEEFMTGGRDQEGIAAFRHAQALEPGRLLNNYRLGAAYYLVGNMASAEMYFQRAVNTYRRPDIVSFDYTLYRLGLSQYAQGKMAQAEATLREAVKLRPKAPGYHVALAAAMQHEGKLVEAEKQVELELQIAPDAEATEILREVEAELNARSEWSENPRPVSYPLGSSAPGTGKENKKSGPKTASDR